MLSGGNPVVGDWPLARKSYVFPVPTPSSAVAGPSDPHALKPTKHPTSIIWANSEEFFNRPVLFNQPVEPVKTMPWVWFEADYLAWWMKRGPLPVTLVTTGNPPAGFGNDVPLLIVGPGAGGGVLGNADTQVLSGQQTLDYGVFSGGRFQGGFWWGDDASWSLHLGGFFTEERSKQFFASSTANGTPTLARPFFDSFTGQPASLLVSAPGAFEGSLAMQSNSQLSGLEVNLRRELFPWFGQRWLALAGFRFLDLEEDLRLLQRTRELDDGRAFFGGRAVPKSAYISLFDSFATENQFFGGQAGLATEWQLGWFVVAATGRAGVGSTVTRFSVFGVSRLDLENDNRSDNIEAGGMLTSASNSEETTRTRLGIVAELNVSLAYEVCSFCRIAVGYDLLYWTEVARPGDQVDPVLNSQSLIVSPGYQQAGGQARPVPRRQRSDFWAQGGSIGLEVRY
jgi:hypothetical protein